MRIILTLSLVILNFTNSYSQKINVKILDVKEIEYYYVCEAISFCSNDSIILISSKADDEFNTIKLEKEKCYKLKTRLRSALKISKDEYFLCKPTQSIINGTTVSDRGKLPRLILDFEEVEDCKFILTEQ